MKSRNTRPISWIRAARKAFDSFPEGPQNAIMRALTVAAEGRKADIAKPLKGFGSGMFEVALQHRTDAYRVVSQPVVKVPWKARRAPAVARRGVRRMAIRVISSDERQSRRLQMSVAQRVTRHSRSAARRARRHVPGTARRYAIGPRTRNAAPRDFCRGLLCSAT